MQGVFCWEEGGNWVSLITNSSPYVCLVSNITILQVWYIYASNIHSKVFFYNLVKHKTIKWTDKLTSKMSYRAQNSVKATF